MSWRSKAADKQHEKFTRRSALPLVSRITDADVALYLDACLAHGRYLRQFQTRGNWVTMEMSGLYTVTAYFPEFKEAGERRQFAAGRMFHEETAQFLPDGTQYELSTMYHNTALENLLKLPVVRQSRRPFAGIARRLRLRVGEGVRLELNLVLWSFGRQLLFNPGGASYERSKWRTYSTEAESKNTVLVDGKGQMRDRNNEADKMTETLPGGGAGRHVRVAAESPAAPAASLAPIVKAGLP